MDFAQRTGCQILLLCTCCLGANIYGGCSPNSPQHAVAELHGRITLDGAPLPKGRMIFQPTQPNMAPASVVSFSDGEYHASEVPRGPILIRVTSEYETGNMISGSSEPVPEILDRVPAPYRQGIPFRVPEGVTEYHVELRSR